MYICKIESCVLEIYSSLLSNGLLLSKDKTKFTIISSALVQSSTQFFVSDKLIYMHPLISFSNLDVLFDERLNFSSNKHILSTCKVSYYHLRCTAHIKRHLDDFSLKTAVHTFVLPV